MKSRKKLNYVIFLMSLALIGLIGLQIYWVNISLQIKKERFSQDVHAALENTVKKLEKREAAFVVRNKFFERKKQNNARFNYIFESKKSGKKIQTAPSQTDDSTLFLGLTSTVQKINTKDISNINIRKNSKGESTIYISTDKNFPPHNFKFSPKRQTVRLRDTGKILNIKSQMVSLVIDELIDRPKNLHERITRDLLDSLLNIELMSRGIDIPYEFNVMGFKNNQVDYVYRAKMDNKHFMKCAK